MKRTALFGFIYGALGSFLLFYAWVTEAVPSNIWQSSPGSWSAIYLFDPLIQSFFLGVQTTLALDSIDLVTLPEVITYTSGFLVNGVVYSLVFVAVHWGFRHFKRNWQRRKNAT